MKKIHQITSGLSYCINSRTEHSLHSPFIFDFYTKVIKNPDPLYDFSKIENLRKELLENNQYITVNDYGSARGTYKRKIKNIARKSLIRPKTGQLLSRIIQFATPVNILELGTSFGISTLYIAMAGTDSKITTIEGCTETAAIAENNFKKINISNIAIHINDIDVVLKDFVSLLPPLDFVYFDANHTYEAATTY
jgi:predicted O-methyltransferase YrrM